MSGNGKINTYNFIRNSLRFNIYHFSDTLYISPNPRRHEIRKNIKKFLAPIHRGGELLKTGKNAPFSIRYYVLKPGSHLRADIPQIPIFIGLFSMANSIPMRVNEFPRPIPSAFSPGWIFTPFSLAFVCHHSFVEA